MLKGKATREWSWNINLYRYTGKEKGDELSGEDINAICTEERGLPRRKAFLIACADADAGYVESVESKKGTKCRPIRFRVPVPVGDVNSSSSSGSPRQLSLSAAYQQSFVSSLFFSAKSIRCSRTIVWKRCLQAHIGPALPC
jgi:hypothetical protein